MTWSSIPCPPDAHRRLERIAAGADPSKRRDRGMTGRGRGTLQVVAERVEPYDPHVGAQLRWDPNAPEAALVSDDMGRGALAMHAHPDDPDQRCVVLRWDAVSYALMGPPNDEALNQHRLYEAGLRDVLWLGVVRDSELTQSLRPMLNRHAVFVPLHYVVITKECVVEVLAENVDVFRLGGTPREAAPASFGP
jgi:hypothetical protein